MEGPHKKYGDPGFQEYKTKLQDWLKSQGRDPKLWSQISYGFRHAEILKERQKKRREAFTDEYKEKVRQRVRQRIARPEVKEQKRLYAKMRYQESHPDVNQRLDVVLAPSAETCAALLAELRIRRPRRKCS